MNQEEHLVIGLGEVGTALVKVLGCKGVDLGDKILPARVIHIAFPYSDSFISSVQTYTQETNAELVVIHSTVPVGTTEKCGTGVTYSPIRGKHPNLEEGIKVFTKFFGGPRAQEAAVPFSERGISTYVHPDSASIEALKLWDTEMYREAVLLNKKVFSFCEEHHLDFDVVYTRANETYNEGYERLGHPEYKKYILKYMPGPIGGHCLEQNHALLWKDSSK